MASSLLAAMVPVYRYSQKSVVSQWTRFGGAVYLGQGVSQQAPDACCDGGAHLLPGKYFTCYLAQELIGFRYSRPNKGRMNGAEASQWLQLALFKTFGVLIISTQPLKTVQTSLSGRFLLKTKNHPHLLGPASTRLTATTSCVLSFFSIFECCTNKIQGI